MERKTAEQMYEAHGPVLAAYLTRLTRDAESARDLLQETFLAFMRQGSGTLRHPRAWLFAVARHQALNAMRRKRPVPLADDPPAPDREQPDGGIESVRRALRGLPAGMREALELKLQDGLSYEEIAAVLGVPMGTVRSRLHHAVRRLRERLAPQSGARGEESGT